MKRTWVIPVIIISVGILVIGIGYIQDKMPMRMAQQPEGWVFTLPDGDAQSGKATFMKMQCTSCHKFDFAGEILMTEMGDIGPHMTLGYHNLSKEYLAESIIKAHTVVATPTYEMKEEQAGMGKYNPYMTVNELTDLVAFLKQPPVVSMK